MKNRLKFFNLWTLKGKILLSKLYLLITHYRVLNLNLIFVDYPIGSFFFEKYHL